MALMLKKFNLEGKETGSVELSEELLQGKANPQMVKDYLVALRANARQWSANTQTRREVNHSHQKPHPQKGTGRARQGFLGATQYRGGGRVGGPRPKFDQHIRINKKERRAAIRYLLLEKAKAGRLYVLETPKMDKPQTKAVVRFLKGSGIEGKRALFLAEGSIQGEVSPKERYANFVRSIRNIPDISFLLLPNLGGYDAALHEDAVLMENALDELKILLNE
uniref:Large ribosomal subunit protein uL4 n=1 Tax=uncultured Chlamydiae bacterium Rifle_16ft_4_minimus_1822 TaxID=1665093 RepID=A0A0H4T1D6_9BACT|nr:50S ribosomal protein L4, large subunit ribosomal protein L4 [uncultured Chlamydiae bacterium Rifle_16ft_4_minimus_1822]